MIGILSASLIAANLPAAQPGACGWVHGRFLVYNGSSVRRIWIVGTRRLVAMRDYDDSAPAAVERYVNTGPHYQDGLFGDFRICARDTRRSGHMQHVRVTATRNLRFRGEPF